jgi:hypothetical protein
MQSQSFRDFGSLSDGYTPEGFREFLAKYPGMLPGPGDPDSMPEGELEDLYLTLLTKHRLVGFLGGR